MKLSVLVLLIFGLTYEVSSDEKITEKKGKLFSLFSVVTFPNNQCTAKSDTTMYGTCYTSSECSNKGGTVDGNCAAGFGVCCTFTISTCGIGITQNCTYITNPSYPSTYTTTGTCAHTVTPINSDICQLRLDFDNFDITETTAGVCTDSFGTSTPSGQPPLDLCGTLTGSHLYLENARSTSTSTLTFTIATGGTWKVKVSQIECSSTSRANPDCDQWITGISGQVSSYNWPNVQLKGKDYTYCIRRESGYCGLQLSQVVPYTSPDSFDLSSIGTVGNANGAIGDVAAAQAVLTINGVVNNPGHGNIFGGTVFGNIYASAANSNSKPGAVLVTGQKNYILQHTQKNVAQTGYEGFSLQFNQLPCSSATNYYESSGL